jgi:hypothetical protein
MTVSRRSFSSKSASNRTCANCRRTSILTLYVADESVGRFTTSDRYDISWETR